MRKRKTSVSHLLKMAAMFLVSCPLSLQAVTVDLQDLRITLNKRNVKVESVMSDIEKQTDLLFIYNKNVNVNKIVSINTKNSTLEEVLKDLFGDEASYKIEGGYIVLSRNGASTNDSQQQAKRTIKGVVKDSFGPIIGANIIEKGTTNGVISDTDGNFTLSVSNPKATLIVTYIGYKSTEVAIGNSNSYEVVMQEDTEALEEVVVIGYGSARKMDLTGSTSSLGGEKLRMNNTPQLSSQLQGQMAGVQITRSSGDPGSGATIRVRGITTLSTNDPLVIIDGVPGNLGDVAPENVKDIQVLKDAASAAIYGSRAAAGVVLVTTKRAKNKEFHLSYNGEYGIDKPTEVPEFANSVQWMTGLNEMTYNDGASSPYSIYSKEMIDNYAQLRAEDPDRYADTDFMGLGLKSHTSHHRHSLSLSGGTDKLKSNFNLGYYSSESLFKNKNYERINIRTNNDYSINKWIHANVDLNMVYGNSEKSHASISELMERAPIYNVYWSDGTFADGKDGDNPIAKQELGGTSISKNYRISGKIQLDIKPIKGLTLTAILAPNYSFAIGKSHTKRYDVYTISGETIPGKDNATTNLSESRNHNHSLTKQLFC